ncbi:MAG: hypothetical protein U0228_06985 [Myxococcaceae bacterium]
MTSSLVLGVLLLTTSASYPRDSPFDAPWFEPRPTGHSTKPAHLNLREVSAAGFLISGLISATGGVALVLEVLHATPFAYLEASGFQHLTSSLVFGVGGAVFIASCFALGASMSHRTADAATRVSWNRSSVVVWF